MKNRGKLGKAGTHRKPPMPHIYSKLLYDLRTARLAGDHTLANKLARQHSAAHGMTSIPLVAV